MAEFNVGGQEWEARQTNGFKVVFNLDQNGQQLTGDADASPLAGGQSTDGDIEQGSRVDGTSFAVTVKWAGGSRGAYHGTFGADGRLHGRTFDINSPGSFADWFSVQTFRRQ